MFETREAEVDQSRNPTPASYRVIHVCDVHHFTGIAAELADRVADFLDEFYTGMGEIAVRREGQILGYYGDCMFFLYGDKGHLPAVQSALAMRQEFARLLSRYDIRCESELENGISAGNVILRVVGHRTLRVPQAFGPAVNEASILGCHRGVAITAPVREYIEPHYRTRRLPDVPVKWSNRRLEAWEIAEPEQEAVADRADSTGKP